MATRTATTVVESGAFGAGGRGAGGPPPRPQGGRVSLPAVAGAVAAPAPAARLPQPKLETLVHGQHRYKFFRRPNVAVLDAATVSVRLDPFADEAAALAESTRIANIVAEQRRALAAEEKEHSITYDAAEGTRTIAIQTAYRDGEAQTDPYTPEYVLPAGAKQPPEVLRLAHLTVGGAPGKSLPAGKAEVENIELAMHRARIEASLPPTTDEASFEVRKRLMEQLELAAYATREREIDGEQAERLRLVEEALRAREAEREFVSEQRVEEVRRRLAAEAEAKVATITTKRLKLLRKLGKQRTEHEAHIDRLTGTGEFASVPVSSALLSGADVAGGGATTRTAAAPGGGGGVGSSTSSVAPKPKGARRGGRDIIAEYADYGSDVYAPRLTNGRFSDKLRPAVGLELNAPALESAAHLAALASSTGITGGGPRVSASRSAAGVAASSVTGADIAPASARRQQALAQAPLTVTASPLRASAAGNIAATGGGLATAAGGLSPTTTQRRGGGAAPPAPLSATGTVSLSTLRKDAALARDLERVHEAIVAAKQGLSTVSVENEGVPTWRRPRAIVERPKTPLLDVDDDEDTGNAGGGMPSGAGGGVGGDDGGAGGGTAVVGGSLGEDGALDRAVLLLQTMLRGRAVQAVMLEGVRRRGELIREMRADLLVAQAAAMDRTAGAGEEEEDEVEAALAAAAAGRGDPDAESPVEEVDEQAEDASLAARARARNAVGDAVAGAVATSALADASAEHDRRREAKAAAEAAARAAAEQAARDAAEALAAQVAAEEAAALAAVHALDAESLVSRVIRSTVDSAAAAAAALEFDIRRLLLGPVIDDVEAELAAEAEAAAAAAAAAKAAAEEEAARAAAAAAAEEAARLEADRQAAAAAAAAAAASARPVRKPRDADEAAVRIQSTYRGDRTRRELGMVRPPPSRNRRSRKATGEAGAAVPPGGGGATGEDDAGLAGDDAGLAGDDAGLAGDDAAAAAAPSGDDVVGAAAEADVPATDAGDAEDAAAPDADAAAGGGDADAGGDAAAAADADAPDGVDGDAPPEPDAEAADGGDGGHAEE